MQPRQRPLSLLLRKRIITFGSRPRLPRQAVTLASVACPGIERIDHRLKFWRKLRDIPHQHALHWRNGLLMSIGSANFHLRWARAIVVHPVDAERGVKLRTEARCEKPIAEESAGSVQNEYNKLSLRNGEPMRTLVLREVSNRRVNIF